MKFLNVKSLVKTLAIATVISAGAATLNIGTLNTVKASNVEVIVMDAEYPTDSALAVIQKSYLNKQVFKPLTSVTSRKYEYYYSQLSGTTKDAYDYIFKMLSKGQLYASYKNVGINFVKYNSDGNYASYDNDLSPIISDYSTALRAVREDHPEYWFLSSIHTTTKGILIKTPTENFTDLQSRIIQTNNWLNEFAKNVSEWTGSDAAMVALIGRSVANNFNYDHNFGPNCRNLYGAASGSTVCVAYAETVNYLCHTIGINATQVQTGEHEWSWVYVNGAWHTFDVCTDYDNWTWTNNYSSHKKRVFAMVSGTELPSNTAAFEPSFNSATKKTSATTPVSQSVQNQTSFGSQSTQGTTTTTTSTVSLSKVKGVKVTKVSGKKYTKITWAKVKNATGYRIYVSKNDGKTWTKIKTTAKNIKSFTYKKYNKNWKYKVRAYSSGYGITSWGKCSVKTGVTK